MDMTREFDEAIALGQANLSILELARNFCEHLHEQPLARGELEAATNLPIGMRMFDCEYATGRNIGAMDLRYVALTFYDDNCNGCDKRKPRGIPNLLDLVRDRDAELARIAAAQEQRALAQRAAFDERNSTRAQLRVGMPAAAAGLLDRIGDLDRENSEVTGALLVETARTVPDQFTEPLRKALKQLANVEGGHRVAASLRALNAIGIEHDELVTLALNALRRNVGCIAAAEVLAEHDVGSAGAEAVQSALPSLIHTAIPLRDFMEPEPARPAVAAAALVKLYRAFPGYTARVLRHLLNDEAKDIRIRAARASQVIIEQEPSFGIEIAGELIRSMSLPDDHYGPVGSAAHAANDALHAAIRSRPDDIDAVIQQARSSGSAPETILDIYREILRPDHSGQLRETKELRQLAFSRLLEAMLSPRSDDDFIEAREFLGYEAERNVDLLPDLVPRLLGAIAILLSRRQQLDEAPLTSRLSLQTPPNPFAAIEMDTRKTWLHRTINDLCELVSKTVVLERARTIPAVIEMLENLGGTHPELRAKLIRILGEAAKDRDILPLVLPLLYRAMTDGEVVVRMEAAEAYRHVAAESSDDLPSLFHETFLCMLVDPYVAVHRAALESLAQIDLPERYRDRATAISWRLVEVHRDSSHPDTLVTALRAFCATSADANPRWNALLPEVVAIVRRLSTFKAHSAVQRLSRRLSRVEGYVDLLVDLLVDPELHFTRSDMLERLHREPLHEIARVAQRLEQAAEADVRQDFRILHAHEHDPIDAFTSLLADAGAWREAEEVARRRAEYLRNSRKSDALKRVARSREIAVAFSRAIAEQRWKDADHQRETWASHVQDAEEPTRFESWFDARLEAYVQLQQCAAGQASQKSVDAISKRLEAAANDIGDTAAGNDHGRLAIVLRGLSFLIEYLQAVREATPDSDRLVRAARRAGKELLDDVGASAADEPFRVAAELLANADEDSIAAVAQAVCTARIGLPLLPRFRYPGGPPMYGEARDEKVEVTIAFTSFRIGGQPVQENEPVEPKLVHDLEVEVVISRWPESAGRLTLDVTTVELPDTFALQPFVFERPAQTLPKYTVTGQGRLLLKEAQAIGPRPLEFQYRARFDNNEGMTVSVEGQRHLRLRSYDPDKTPQTGSADADRKLLEIADIARQYSGVSDSELGYFLRIMTRTAALAVQSLQDNKFPGQWNEPRFQEKAVEFLRGDPRIGSKLQQHAEAAAGETDLTFYGMPIELKVEKQGEVTCESVVGFADQAIQYAVGNARRFAVLAVLDTSEKNEAPVLASNDISFAPQTKRNGKPIETPVLLGTVIIRGNLSQPSSHSRRGRRGGRRAKRGANG